MLKMRLFHQFAQEKQFIWKSCNLIGREDFGVISGTRFFLKDLCRNTANKNLQYRINTVLNFSLNSKKTNLWLILAHFLNFWGKKSFSMKLSCYAQLLQGFWHHAKIQRNLKIQFQQHTQTDLSKNGQTLSHRILPATTKGLTSKTTVNWHLQVKDIEYMLVLPKIIGLQSACKK